MRQVECLRLVEEQVLEEMLESRIKQDRETAETGSRRGQKNKIIIKYAANEKKQDGIPAAS